MSNGESRETPEVTLEELPRKDFMFTTWEGLAVSPEEFDLIQGLAQNERLRNQIVDLSQRGSRICDESGVLDIPRLAPAQLLGTRVDGLGFFLQALAVGSYPPRKNGERVRSMTEGGGTLFTALSSFAIDEVGKIAQIQNLAPDEITKMIRSGKVYELDAALIDATYPLLFPEVRTSEQFMTLLTYPLRKDEGIYERDRLAFQYKGEALWEYLKLIAKQRSGVRWGINRNIIEDNSYRFDQGHVAAREIQIQNREGVILTKDISFITTKPNTLEHKIIEVCQRSL